MLQMRQQGAPLEDYGKALFVGEPALFELHTTTGVIRLQRRMIKFRSLTGIQLRSLRVHFLFELGHSVLFQDREIPPEIRIRFCHNLGVANRESTSTES